MSLIDMPGSGGGTRFAPAAENDLFGTYGHNTHTGNAVAGGYQGPGTMASGDKPITFGVGDDRPTWEQTITKPFDTALNPPVAPPEQLDAPTQPTGLQPTTAVSPTHIPSEELKTISGQGGSGVGGPTGVAKPDQDFESWLKQAWREYIDSLNNAGRLGAQRASEQAFNQAKKMARLHGIRGGLSVRNAQQNATAAYQNADLEWKRLHGQGLSGATGYNRGEQEARIDLLRYNLDYDKLKTDKMYRDKELRMAMEQNDWNKAKMILDIILGVAKGFVR